MDMPKGFQLVKQPAGSLVCGAAVCAMAVGKTLEHVLEECDWRELTYMGGVAAYLGRHGVSMGTWVQNTGRFPETIELAIDPEYRPAILSVRSATYEDGYHWVFWTGKEILDPSVNEQEEYTVCDVAFLTYHLRPEYFDTLHPDWRQQTAAGAGLVEL